ncbi:MAG: hypothetical protein AAFZ63_12220 [Bacteroidota bacterium]
MLEVYFQDKRWEGWPQGLVHRASAGLQSLDWLNNCTKKTIRCDFTIDGILPPEGFTEFTTFETGAMNTL